MGPRRESDLGHVLVVAARGIEVAPVAQGWVCV